MDWWNCSTCIAKDNGTNSCNKCCRACCINKADSVIAFVRLCKLWEFAWCFPVKLTAINNYTTDCCTMSADKLSCWMNNDISTIFKWTNKIWSCKCAIDYKRNVVSMCNLCNSFNICNFWIRIAKCLDIKSLCVILDCIFKILNIKRVNECCSNTVINDCMCKVVICTTINILCGYDMVTCKCKILNCISNGCCTWCYSKSCDTAFKSSHSLLENIFCRICKSAINVTCIL